jgi:hypothetical protein
MGCNGRASTALRFRAQQGCRIEAAATRDEQPVFEDPAVEVLNEIAGRWS